MNPQLTASQDFVASPTAVRAARLFAVLTALSWGLDPADLETVVGELAANAYAHAQSPFTVSLSRDDWSLSVEVEDSSTQLPVLAVGPPDSLRGRGLIMVNAIARTWGSRATDEGKVVWAELLQVAVTA